MPGNKHWSDSEEEYLLDNYSDTPIGFIQDRIDRTDSAIHRKAMRLGVERNDRVKYLHGISDVEEYESVEDSFGYFIAGFVSGEGSFVHRYRDDGRERFSFSIAMSDRDEDILYEIKEELGVGNIYYHEKRKEHWDDGVSYVVQSIPELLKVIIPLFNEFGFRDTYKTEQYSVWKTSLFDYVGIESLNDIERFL